MSRVYIGGAGGTGKTALCQELRRILRIKVYSGSAVMMNASGVTSRDELSRLPDEAREMLCRDAFVKLYQENETMILEGHFYFTKHDAHSFCALILIEADPLDVLLYRLNDKGRNRSTEKSTIEQDLAKTRKRAQEAASVYNLPLYVIKNFGSLRNLVKQVCGILQKEGVIEKR